MKSMIFCMIVAFCASIAGIGGTVILKDGKTLTDVTLEGITTDMIKVSGKEIPRDTVKKLETRKFDVPAKPMWIVLADGTVLNGLLGKFSPEKVTFYSVICGALEIPVEKVAVLITAGTMPTVLPKGIESPTVLQQAGGKVSGKVMWADSKSIGLMTNDGLKKLERQQLGPLVFKSVSLAENVTLRNGDRLNGVSEANGTRMKVNVLDQKYEISIWSLKTFTP